MTFRVRRRVAASLAVLPGLQDKAACRCNQAQDNFRSTATRRRSPNKPQTQRGFCGR